MKTATIRIVRGFLVLTILGTTLWILSLVLQVQGAQNVQPTPSKPDTIGIYRPSLDTFYLRNENTKGSPNMVAQFKKEAEKKGIPLVGDWNGDGNDTIAFFYTDNAQFHLKNANNSAATVVHRFAFGKSGDLPVVGDWNGDGKDGIGIYRSGTFFLIEDVTLTTTPNYYIKFGGEPNDIPISGDWDGDGKDSVGVFRRGKNAQFFLSNTLCKQCSANLDYQFLFGLPTDLPIVGNWDNQGGDGVGVFRPQKDSLFIFKNELAKQGTPDLIFNYGTEEDIPVIGKW